jgi:hypothetical protein
LKPSKLRWKIATPEIRAKAIELAGGADALALLLAKDLLKETGEKLSAEIEADTLGISASTVRRRKKRQ